jgi:putative IMPACT (imprinted ancient) family translation regulator
VANEAVYQRYSDDGEPSGTAGMPILEVIRKKQLVNVVVVVTRYFGGILLGAGGLVRAYGKAAAGGLEDACGEWVIDLYSCKNSHRISLSGKLQNMLMHEGYLVRDVAYTDDVTFEVLLETLRRDNFEKMLNDLTGGRSDVTYLGKVPVKLDLKGNVLEMG